MSAAAHCLQGLCGGENYACSCTCELCDPSLVSQKTPSALPDPINPAHYKSHPSGVECVTVTEHMTFNLGNAVKYIWRAGLKSADPREDLAKARWYLDREIARLEKEVVRLEKRPAESVSVDGLCLHASSGGIRCGRAVGHSGPCVYSRGAP